MFDLGLISNQDFLTLSYSLKKGDLRLILSSKSCFMGDWLNKDMSRQLEEKVTRLCILDIAIKIYSKKKREPVVLNSIRM